MDSQVTVIRSFNRLVTETVGALNDRYLSRGRSLGASRVLWEIGEDGRDVRSLRAKLDLDSGYLSRLLRVLEADGLVRTSRNPRDGRVRIAQLTSKGRRERALLDRRSDELARSILEPLSESQRVQLVDSMAAVERLLRARLVEIEAADPASPEAQACLDAYVAELDRRFPGGFDPQASIPAAPESLRPPHGVFLLATLHGEAVGCGALKLHPARPTELKRMWVAGSVRGIGLGRRLLRELEDRAVEAGSELVRLETNATLVEAIALYRAAGYVEVAAFNDDPYADHWFEKRLWCGVS